MEPFGDPLARRDAANPLKAMVIAALAAAAILVAIVLPAEYGIDWTGAGSLTGLTAMGRDKVAAEKAAKEPPAPAPATAEIGAPARESGKPLRTDTIDVAIGPGVGLEYKAVLAEGEAMVFDWDAGGSEIKFDFHGEPEQGPAGMFLTFKKGAAAKDAGSLRAPFSGTHGWYWKNAGSVPVVVKLRVSGFHSELKRM